MKCGKFMHRNEDLARRHLERIKAFDPGDPRKEWLNVYFCRDCRKWHVGHMPRSMRVKRSL